MGDWEMFVCLLLAALQRRYKGQLAAFIRNN